MNETQDAQQAWADRVAKLLRKAENTDSPAEAEALTAKAQALMVKFAITEDLLARARGDEVQDHIVEDRIIYRGIFHPALFDIGKVIAHHNNIFTMISKQPNITMLLLVGYTKDIANVKVLDMSLQIQASTAMQRWYRTEVNDTGISKMQKYKMRREFLFGYARGLHTKLALAKREGLKEAVADEARRTGDAAQAQTSTDLVLRTKDENVKDWVDRTYGRTLRSVKRNYQSGGFGASVAGQAAGRNADLGNTRLGGKREIGG